MVCVGREKVISSHLEWLGQVGRPNCCGVFFLGWWGRKNVMRSQVRGVFRKKKPASARVSKSHVGHCSLRISTIGGLDGIFN